MESGSMERLPHCLLLQILSRLDDSADVARCRVASKAFSTVFPGLRSINLRCSDRYSSSDLPQKKNNKIRNIKYLVNSPRCVSSSQHVKPFKTVFLDLISKLETVESVCITYKSQIFYDSKLITDVGFIKEWLPMVSGSLKSLSLYGQPYEHSQLQTNVLPVISAYCHNLVNLKLGYFAWLSMENLNPMPMLTSLTLSFTTLEDEYVNELHKWFPNLQVLKLEGVIGLRDPKIHLLSLKTCIWDVDTLPQFFTLNTPNLTTLRIVCRTCARPRVEAPMLGDLQGYHEGAFILKKCGKMETLSLECSYLGSLLSKFPITKTVKNLTLDSRNKERYIDDSELTLGKVFTAFPNVTSLCIKSGVWSELEACSNLEGWEILDGRKGLKTIRAYLMLVDPSLTFSSVACVFDQCVRLSEASLLIHDDVVATVSTDFMSKCMARWPRLKWKWGVWSEEDSSKTDVISNPRSPTYDEVSSIMLYEQL